MEIARCVGQVERGALLARLEGFGRGGLANGRGGLPYGQDSADAKSGLSGALEGEYSKQAAFGQPVLLLIDMLTYPGQLP